MKENGSLWISKWTGSSYESKRARIARGSPRWHLCFSTWKHITKRIADDTNTNTIGVKEQGLGTSIINFFLQKGDELRNQMEEMGLSKEEANLYEEKLDQGKILLLVTAEVPIANARQPQNYHSL